MSDPAGVASVEPLSLKGTTGVGGSGLGKDVTVLLKQYQQGREALVRGGQVWNSLKVGRGGHRPVVSPPHCPRPGECQLPRPALVAAGDQTFRFGHLLGGLPLLSVRGALPLGQLLLHLLS